MSPDVQEHLFEPFFTTKDVGEGTGLGLAMVYGAVQQHGGKIEVHSEPDAGSTFTIFLPKAEGTNPVEQEPAAGEVSGGEETILVAEDEEDVLNMLCIMLERKGYRILTARDGREALAVYQAQADEIDLVILDMVMPKVRGREAYKQIRKNGSDVAVLFSTGYSLDSADAEFVTRNSLPLIQKPYSSGELCSIVRDILDQSRTGAAG
jgi:CheY-like chemotaxis protein